MTGRAALPRAVQFGVGLAALMALVAGAVAAVSGYALWLLWLVFGGLGREDAMSPLARTALFLFCSAVGLLLARTLVRQTPLVRQSPSYAVACALVTGCIYLLIALTVRTL